MTVRTTTRPGASRNTPTQRGRLAAPDNHIAGPLHLRAIWLTLAFLASLITATIGGLLAGAGGMSLPEALGVGGAAFAASLSLIMGVIRFLYGDTH